MASSIIFFVGIYFLLNVALGGGAVEFDYSNPDEWGSLSPQFELCSSGKQQSPIDIVHAETIVNNTLHTLSRDYHLDSATLVNTGVSIKVKVKGKSEFDIDGKKYVLLQVHWHTPSEHLFNGIR
ncbi:hypothetical protein Nepgr_011757 [Nepenthes gracilis]|uniref:Alpha-carbonic anhydrase domain-containing protein n=1 Tax=Nepenthes gracilis TaxID=150966 RepID=A0AAD3XMN2_NEPGR|nr:hypothetical protein Nepgr_011757 [Nepenthes gracilis]